MNDESAGKEADADSESVSGILIAILDGVSYLQAFFALLRLLAWLTSPLGRLVAFFLP